MGFLKQFTLQKIPLFLIYFLILIALSPYIYMQFEMSLNTNHAWLLIAAQRFIEGGSPLKDFFEPNPPMSIILYVPQYLMHSVLQIPLRYIPALTGYLSLAISSFITYRLLQIVFQNSPHRINILLSAFISAAIFIPHMIYFSDRDYFVFLALFPVILGQLAITQNYPLKPITARLLFVLGGMVLLIKPHYGLYPATMLIHRLYTKKTLSSVFYAPDFQGLLAGLIFYLVLIGVFFPDYITYVLPHFISLYLDQRYSHIWLDFAYYSCFIFILILATYLIPLEKNDKIIIAALNLATFVGLLLFLLQGKGFYYHAIPAFGFYFMAVIVLLCAVFKKITNNFALRKGYINTIFLTFICICLGYYFSPPVKDFPTHSEYKKLPLSEAINECQKPCPYLVLSSNMDIISQVSLYSGEKHILRFPSLWWVGPVKDNPELIEMKDELIQYVAEDIKRHKPKIIFSRVDFDQDNKKVFDYAQYLLNESAFIREEFGAYKKGKMMKDNLRYYFQGSALDYDSPIFYDVYYRVENSEDQKQ